MKDFLFTVVLLFLYSLQTQTSITAKLTMRTIKLKVSLSPGGWEED